VKIEIGQSDASLFWTKWLGILCGSMERLMRARYQVFAQGLNPGRSFLAHDLWPCWGGRMTWKAAAPLTF